MKVYITKYALTTGILCADVEGDRDPDIVSTSMA